MKGSLDEVELVIVKDLTCPVCITETDMKKSRGSERQKCEISVHFSPSASANNTGCD